MEEENQEEEKEQKTHRPYKIMEGDIIFVKRVDIVGSNGQPYVFYSTNLPQKNSDGKKDYYKKELYFRGDVNLQNDTRIKILNMFEKARPNQRDKYQPIWGLFINDFETIDTPNYIEQQDNLEDYQGINDQIGVNW